MPVVLSDRDYLALKAHMRQTDQELVNVKNRITGASRQHARGASGLSPIYTPFYNDSGETIPAHGVMRITNSSRANKYVVCAKPNAVFQGLYLVNCGSDVGYQKTGYGSFLMGDSAYWQDRFVLYNTAATPSPGESWSPISNSWVLHQHGPGFGILGAHDATKGTVAVIQIPPAEILVKRTAGSLAANSSGEFELWGGVAGSEADSGTRVTALNKMSVAFGDEKFGAVGILNGQGYAVRFQE